MKIKNKTLNFARIEKKWQKRWYDEGIFEVKEEGNKKFYVLEMYPYPSSSGLHMGHAFNYTIGDILARYMRMRGYNVLHPAGFDSFGLPAENAAINAGEEPEKYTNKAIKNFIKQQKALGLSYAWKRQIKSHDPKYYRWNQHFFLQMMKKGLVYRKKSSVNWCPKCNSVLANEQVHSGRCWRHSDTEIQIKILEQWFVKITKYADELLKEIENLDWPEKIKLMQKNWIGKSEGAEIVFLINNKEWNVFTTRADTLMGVTFLVISAQHPELMQLVTEEQKKNVEDFLKKIKSTSKKDTIELEKEGVFTGSYALHPLTKEKIPVWVGNFVVADYGSGIVMGVPAHDQRDFEFAKKYSIPIKQVIIPESEEAQSTELDKAFEDPGILINSGNYNKLKSEEAKEHIIKDLENKKLGKKATNYKLRDWLVSRQRYWGTPIPIIHCSKCGVVTVPEKDLPVLLPKKVKFGKGNPLETNKKFVNVRCPVCNERAKRETDTMDTFFDSSWYYLRFTDPENNEKCFERKNADYWMPVDFYTGGTEHACMHLIYARFFTKILRDIGYIKFNEPFKKLFNQGMVHGEDGKVMSKSAGNGVDPLEIVEKLGADSLRLFLISNASPDKDFVWNSAGVESSAKTIEKIYSLKKTKFGESSPKFEHRLNKMIKEINKDIEEIKYNQIVIKIRQFVENFESCSKEDFLKFIKIISPFIPHVAEELWEFFGGNGFVSQTDWPEADEKRIRTEFDKIDEIFERTISDILNVLKIIGENSKETKRVYLYVIPNEITNYDVNILSRRVGKEVVIFAVNDKNKYDPAGKSGKAKPGKPGIYIE